MTLDYWDELDVPEPVEPEDIVEAVWMALWLKFPVILSPKEDRTDGDDA
jgi:hypothetical protein